MLAILPRPTPLGIDQRVINSCADTTRKGAVARDLVIAGKTDTPGGKRTSIETTAVALDVSPMSVSLNSENRPLDLPVSSKLSSEIPATDWKRSLGPAEQRQRSTTVWPLGRDRGQRRVLIPTVLIVPPASTAADFE